MQKIWKRRISFCKATFFWLLFFLASVICGYIPFIDRVIFSRYDKSESYVTSEIITTIKWNQVESNLIPFLEALKIASL